jgi:DNA-binding MarR family transcriptional regulator
MLSHRLAQQPPVPMPLGPAALANSRSDTSIIRSDQRVIQILLWALKPLANLKRPMPLPSLTAFLLVAHDEGKGVNAYARAAGIDRAIMSRTLHAIGDRARTGGPGLGLITMQPHPTDPKRVQIFMTSTGRSIAKEISRQLQRAGKRRY